METDELIRRLAESAQPVRPLAAPWKRAACWLAVALPAVAAIVMAMSPRDDLAILLTEPRYLIEQAAAFATAVAAALAAFCLIVPGRRRWPALMPIVPLTIWLGSLGQGCLQDWFYRGGAGLGLSPDWVCFPSIVAVGAAPAVAMVVLLRKGAPMAPRLTVALGGLAAAALGNFGLRLFHAQDASLMVLVWQVGTVAILSALAGLAGRLVLSWPRLERAA